MTFITTEIQRKGILNEEPRRKNGISFHTIKKNNFQRTNTAMYASSWDLRKIA